MLQKINKTYLYLFSGSFILRLITFFVLSWWITTSGLFTAEQQSLFPALNNDSEDYYQISENIYNHGVFSSDFEEPLSPNSFRTPIYPYFISLFSFLGLGKFGAVIVQMLLSSLLVVLVFILSNKFFSHKVSLIASILFAIEPYSVFISDILLTEVLFTLLLTLSIIFLFNEYDFQKKALFIGISGLFMGLATLTRPVSMFLIPLGALFIIPILWNKFKYKSILLGLIFFLISMGTISPWLTRNENVFGYRELASNGWNNAVFWNVSMHKSIVENRPLVDVVSEYKNQIDPDATTEELKGFTYIEVEKEIATKYIKDNFWSYSKFHTVKTLPFFVSDGFREIASFLRIRPSAPLPNFTDNILKGNFGTLIKEIFQGGWFTFVFLVGVLLWTTITILTAIGFIYGLKNKKARWFVITSGLLIIYFAVISAPLSPGRMRYVAEPLMFILVALGIKRVIYFLETNSLFHILKSKKGEKTLSSSDFA